MKNQRSLTYAEAIYEATVQEMERDSSVFVMGQGVDDPKGTLGTTMDLHKRFGVDRSFDTPLAEDGMTGIAIGAALAGQRPIHIHIRMDFMLLCMNQLINIAAKSRYSFGGAVNIPMVVRGCIGRSWGQGPQHSQALHSFFMHSPGIKVVAPSTPHDAKGCLIAAIRDDNPVVFIEHRMLYGLSGYVPEDPFEVPFGAARIMTAGHDITILAIGHMVLESLRAGRFLASVDVSAEVIDPVSLSPLDIGTVIASVRRTRRLLVVDNAWLCCGASAEIITEVMEKLQGEMSIRVGRMGFAEAPCPTTRSLEDLFYPNSATIATRACMMVKGENGWMPEIEEAEELAKFRGPF